MVQQEVKDIIINKVSERQKRQANELRRKILADQTKVKKFLQNGTKII